MDLPYYFAVLPSSVFDVIASAVRRTSYAPGDWVVQRGTPCAAALVVLRGMVSVGIFDRDTGGFDLVTHLGASELYGSHSRNPGATNGLDVFAVGQGAELLEIPGDALARALELDRSGALAATLSPTVRRLLTSLAPEGIENEALLRLTSSFSTRQLKEGELLFAAGDPVNDWFFVEEGSVRLGERTFGAGEDVGFEAMMVQAAAFAPAVASVPTRVLVGSGAVLWREMARCAHLRAALARRVARRSAVWSRAPSIVHTDFNAPDSSKAENVDEAQLLEVAETSRPMSRWRPLPFTRQLEQMDCGAACLRMIARYHGHELDYSALLRLAAVSRYGTSLLDLARAGEALGFVTSGVEVGWDALASVQLPAIAHLADRHHFVVVWRVDRGRVVIGDPALMTRTMSREEFERGWRGTLLLLRPTSQLGEVAKELASKSGDGPLASFLPWLRPYRRTFVEVIALSFALQLLSLALPLGSQVIIDRVVMRGDGQLLNVMVGGLLATSLVVAIFQYARAYLVLDATTKLERDLVDTLYRRIVGGVSGFFQRFTTSDILIRFAEVSIVRSFVIDNAVAMSVDFVMVVGAAAALLLYAPTLALFVFALVPIQLLITALVGRWIRSHTAAYLSHRDGYQTHLMDSFKAFEMIKAHGLELPFTRTMQRLLAPTLEHSFRALQHGARGASLSVAFDLLCAAMVLWIGAQRVLDGSMTIGTLVAATLLARQVVGPVARIATQWREYARTRASLERVGALLAIKGEETATSTAVLELPAIVGVVRFLNVGFSYDESREAKTLRSINVEIAAGEVVAIVGPSGCGKSTLVRLLLRMHDPTEGGVTIDGINLRDVTPESIRRQMGLVTQDTHLLSATVFDNIKCGRAVSEEAVVRATQIAGAYDFISRLPHGFHTLVGERGLPLSGGQRQRLIVARALVTDPRILVFDEATAALDPLSEQSIHANLREVVRGRTTIIISHRIQTLRHVDRIIVMNEGTISQVGTHESLIAAGGKLYGALAQATPTWRRVDQEDENAAA